MRCVLPRVTWCGTRVINVPLTADCSLAISELTPVMQQDLCRLQSRPCPLRPLPVLHHPVLCKPICKSHPTLLLLSPLPYLIYHNCRLTSRPRAASMQQCRPSRLTWLTWQTAWLQRYDCCSRLASHAGQLRCFFGLHWACHKLVG